MTNGWQVAGTLAVRPIRDALELLAPPVSELVQTLPDTELDRFGVAEIAPDFADTAALCAEYDVPLGASANCVIVTGKRAGEQRWAACMVLATMRADVNNVVRKRLDVRKASFASQDEAVSLTGMEYGGITPLGLPEDWSILLDPAVAEADELVIGSGLRRSKVLLPGEALATLKRAEVVPGLGIPVS